MLRMLLERLLIVALACLAALELAHWAAPPQAMPLIHADYQRCVRVNPGPLTAPPPGKLRTDTRTRDGGIA